MRPRPCRPHGSPLKGRPHADCTGQAQLLVAPAHDFMLHPEANAPSPPSRRSLRTLSFLRAEPVQRAQFAQLFALYDIRGEGTIREWEFCEVQALVARLTAGSVQAPTPAQARTVLDIGRGLQGARGTSSGGGVPKILRTPQQSHVSLPSLFPSSRPGSALLGGQAGNVGLPVQGHSAANASKLPAISSAPKLELWQVEALPCTWLRNPSSQASARRDFKAMDEDGDGLIGFDDFARWQERLAAASGKCRAAKQQRLAWLIRDLARLQEADPRFLAWRRLAEAAAAAAEAHGRGEELAALRALEGALRQAGGTLGASGDAMMGALKQQSLEWQGAYQQRLLSSLEGAAAVPALEAALREAEEARPEVRLAAEALQLYEQRLGAWRAPFALHVATLAGRELQLEASRVETVGALRARVAQGLGKPAYRVMLATVQRRLEPDAATLEELGIRYSADAAVAAAFGPVDRWLEMSVPEFLELCVAQGVLLPSEALLAQGRVDSGASSYQELQARFAAAVETKERAAAGRRREEEAAEATRREAVREAAAAAAALFAEARDARRVALAEAGADALLEELQATVPQLRAVGSLFRHLGGRGRCKAAAVELLAERAAAEHLEAEVTKASHESARLEAVVSQLRIEVERQLEELQPELEEAINSIDQVTKADMYEAKMLNNARVHLTLEVLCVMFGIRPERRPDPNLPERTVDDFVRPARKELFGNARVLQMMKEYDKENISPKLLSQLQRYARMEAFQPDVVARASSFCGTACSWAHAVLHCALVARQVEPMKQAMSLHEKELQRLRYWQAALSTRAASELQDLADRCRELELDAKK